MTSCKPYLIVVGVFIILDIVSGLLKAFYSGEFNSEKMRKGIYHKATYVLIIALAITCELSEAYIELGFSIPLVKPTTAYIIFCEFMSIIENIGAINPSLKEYTDRFMHNE